MKKEEIKIGRIFSIGIGNGESVKAEVVAIEEDQINGDQAMLRMVKFGGPLQKRSVAYLIN